MLKSILALAFVTMSSGLAFANDGGIAAIKVDQIKMRETRYQNGEEVIVKKYVEPNFTITFEGGEAEKLQKILPSELSVITAIDPSIEKQFNETFKTLGIYADKSAAASAKILTISCSNGELSFLEDGKASIKKSGKTKCTIKIGGDAKAESLSEYFGDIGEFEPKTCQ